MENPEIDYYFIDGGKAEAIIAGFDFYVGVTIVDKYIKHRNLLCIQGPLSPRAPDPFPMEMHKACMKLIAEQIKAGKAYEKDYDELAERFGNPDLTCAYRTEIEMAGVCAFN